MSAHKRFEDLNLVLPPTPRAMGVYKPFMIVGNMAYVSGHGTFKADGSLIVGRIGLDMNKEEGKMAARQVGLSIVSTLCANLESLDRIAQVVKVLGMVNCTSDFEEHPFVINGCSELFAGIWGEENGIGVRSAVGMGSLPGNIPVEIEAQFLLHG